MRSVLPPSVSVSEASTSPKSSESVLSTLGNSTSIVTGSEFNGSPLCVYVTEICVLPDALPVTVPSADTEATSGLLDVHVIAGSSTAWPLRRTLAVSFTVLGTS